MGIDQARDLHIALREYFGFESFREEQEEVVRRAVEGRDTLALMPTGAGKSLCYQLAAMLRPTPTLVLSPLIALMKDQVDNLPPQVRAHASLINSSLDPAEASRRLKSLAAGDYNLIYAAPERLRQRNFVEALRWVNIGLVVIDEVHCVSMWGHDFRPDYLFIRSALGALGNPAVLGLTATATPSTAADISKALGRNLETVRTSVVRPNLRYEVDYVENEEAKLRATLTRVRSQTGSGIIYARSREKCEQIARLLYRNGVRALHYHARLESAERNRVQERFLSGDARAIVATTAFGMGIDKPDVRWVILYNFPDSLEDYVQRVGRAGRDGLPSTCTLLVSNSDAGSLKRFALQDVPTIDELRNVYRVMRGRLREDAPEISPEDLRQQADLAEDEDPRVLVSMLERVGLLRRDYDAGRSMRIELLPPPDDTVKRIESLVADFAAGARTRAERMIGFAASSRCRHLQVAEHFGETVPVPCGMCDICEPGADVEASADARPLPRDIARVIVDAVESLKWPVGVNGLAATLNGSVDAPPSAQRSKGFGVLSSAAKGTVRRWVSQLIENGNLEQFESDDGFRLLRVADRDGLPQIYAESAKPPKRGLSARLVRGEPAPPSSLSATPLSAEDQEFFDRLKVWRRVRAESLEVPAYVVAPDRTLRAIAGTRPTTREELSQVDGIGPAKLDQYGDEILALISERNATDHSNL